MMPVLCSFGPFQLYSWGLLLAAGMLLSLYLMRRRARGEGFPGPDDCSDVMFWLFIWGFTGGRLLYVLENLSYYLAHPLRIFALWEGGLVFYGGVIAGLVGFFVTVRMKKLPFWKFLDFVAPYVALTQAFARVGCFLSGCCYGEACALPWAVRFPQTAGAVHPTQIYEVIYDLALFAWLLARHRSARPRRALFEGETGLLYFLLYALGRFLIEFVRDPGLGWLGLTLNQWISAGIMVVALVFLKVRQRRSAAPSAS